MVTDAPGVEWPPNSPTETGSHHRDRCLTSRLGSCVRSYEYRGSLVRGRERASYQCPGVGRRSSRDQDLPEGQGEHTHPSQDGQQDGDLLYQSHWGHEVSHPVAGCLRSLALVSPERNHPVGRASPRGREHPSRLGIQDTAVNSRMDVRKVHLPHSQAGSRTLLSGSICDQAQQPTGEVCQLAPRPFRNSNRRLPTVMAGRDWVHISPVFPDREMPSEGASGGVYSGYGDPCVGHAILVPSTPGTPGGVSIADSNTRESATGSFHRAHPMVLTNKLQLAAWKVSGDSTLQRAFHSKLQTSSLRDGAKGLTRHTSLGGRDGVAGVLRGKLIPFREMFFTS